MNTAELVVGGLCGVVIVSIFVWIGVALRVGHVHMDLMLGHLKNSPSVMSLAPLRHGGPWGRLMLIGGISGFVTFAGFYSKRGSISVEDINSLPSPLKHKLVALHFVSIGLFAAMVVLVLLGKSGVLK